MRGKESARQPRRSPSPLELAFRSENRCLGDHGMRRGDQLLADNRHIARCFNSKANLAPIDVHHRDANVVVDVDLFTQLAAQYQHFATLLRASSLIAAA